jgi:hypothetical protein
MHDVIVAYYLVFQQQPARRQCAVLHGVVDNLLLCDASSAAVAEGMD